MSEQAQHADAAPADAGGALRPEIEAAAPAVRRYLLGVCGDWHTAEDLAQQAVLKAWQSRASFNGQAQVRTWLFAIARNTWLDYLRRRKTAPTTTQVNEEIMVAAHADTSPQTPLMRSELAAAVAAAMAHLPAEQREALALRESQGLKFDQIAELLGVPAATVKSRVRYALLKLAEQLKEFAPEGQA